MARIVTGLFGGVAGAISFAIVTDVFEPSVRGRVMGILQTSFAVSPVLGLPAGLFLANRFGWHTPFLAIVVFGLGLGILTLVLMKPVAAHLEFEGTKSVFNHFAGTLTHPLYVLGFVAALGTLDAFMLMPLGSAFVVRNLGVELDMLPALCLLIGLSSAFAGPLLGRLSDSRGSVRVFTAGSALVIAMVAYYTGLGVTPLGWVLAIMTVLFVGVTGRMVSSQALLSTLPAPQSRGAFMSVSSPLATGGRGSSRRTRELDRHRAADRAAPELRPRRLDRRRSLAHQHGPHVHHPPEGDPEDRRARELPVLMPTH